MEPREPSISDAPRPDRSVFRRRHRLGGSESFTRVFRRGVRKSAGPLTVIALPNELPDHRLGLSVGKRVGAAVRRVGVKRRLREAFRLSRSSLPRAPGVAHDNAGFDWVITVRAHAPLTTPQYRALLERLAQRIEREWSKRASRADSRPGPTDRRPQPDPGWPGEHEA